MSKLTHIDGDGAAHMVDVGGKADTVREAHAEGRIAMKMEVLEAIKANAMIPLCHPLALTKVAVDFDFLDDGIKVRSLARLRGKTGVEMEALTACSVALLTIYDMSKAMQKDMEISDIRLLSKSGGKSGDWVAE